MHSNRRPSKQTKYENIDPEIASIGYSAQRKRYLLRVREDIARSRGRVQKEAFHVSWRNGGDIELWLPRPALWPFTSALKTPRRVARQDKKSNEDVYKSPKIMQKPFEGTFNTSDVRFLGTRICAPQRETRGCTCTGVEDGGNALLIQSRCLGAGARVY